MLIKSKSNRVTPQQQSECAKAEDFPRRVLFKPNARSFQLSAFYLRDFPQREFFSEGGIKITYPPFMNQTPLPGKRTAQDSSEPASKPNPSGEGFSQGMASTASATTTDAGEK
jgi:hypothetical protein